jgi:hypothetical protein
MPTDIHGLKLTGASAAAAAEYEAGVAELQCYRGDPVARVDAALAEAPGFAMAHALKGWLHLLGTEPGGLAVAREAQEAAARCAGTAREKGHAAALGHLVEGRWHAACQSASNLDPRSASNFDPAVVVAAVGMWATRSVVQAALEAQRHVHSCAFGSWLGDQARVLKRQLSFPVSTMSQ